MTAATMTTGVIAGQDGLNLAADRFGQAGGQPVVLLHGGGQTRHAWGATAGMLAEEGYDVLSLDLRGHGDSEWSPTQNYRLEAFRDDVARVLDTLHRPAVLVGASLGGLASLLAAGETAADRVRALVLVDITTRNAPAGTDPIFRFMTSNTEGFDSVEQAADAVAAYLPHRPRPRDPNGLMKNLRLRDGRLYWHWDPQFVKVAAANRPLEDNRLADAARHVTVPTLLIRGGDSDVVTAREAEELCRQIPQARVAVVDGARHMVAGDQNTVFGNAVLDFLRAIAPSDAAAVGVG
jgi:pimeloyl-ACP methyl ester carboxylesterase